MKSVFTSLCFLIMVSGNVYGQDRPTHEIHAAMLYNFIRYVQWPDESAAGEFVVGVIGDDNVFNTLKTWYDGKPKGSKKYVVRKLATSAEANACHVVYLGKSKNREFENVKASTTGRSILTVTDGNSLGHKGSCINFKIVDGKLKFELNQNTLTSSNLKISSQLSSMAILI